MDSEWSYGDTLRPTGWSATIEREYDFFLGVDTPCFLYGNYWSVLCHVLCKNFFSCCLNHGVILMSFQVNKRPNLLCAWEIDSEMAITGGRAAHKLQRKHVENMGYSFVEKLERYWKKGWATGLPSSTKGWDIEDLLTKLQMYTGAII